MRKWIFYVFLLWCFSASAQQWYPEYVPYGRDVNAVYIQNTSDVFVAGGHTFNDSIQSVFQTNGTNWNYIIDLPVHRGIILDMTFTDSLHGYACGFNGNLITSADAGQTWTLRSTPITGRNYRKLAFIDSLKGFAVGSNYDDSTQTIIGTIDGGATWTTIMDQPGHGLNAITFINADTGFAVGDTGVILKTINGGGVWTTVVAPVSKNFKGIRFINSSTGFIVGGNDTARTILRTIDGGNTWVTQVDLNGSLLTDIDFHGSKGFIVGNNSTLLVSVNAGQTWAYDTVSAFGPFSSLTCVRFYNDSFGVVGAKGGTVFIYTGASAPSVYTLSSALIDSSDVTLSMSVNTHGSIGQYYFVYASDSTWNNYLISTGGAVTDDSAQIRNELISGLTPHTVYRYYAACSSISGTVSGDTLKFYTGIPYTTFATTPPSNTTVSSATLNGMVDKFLVPVNLDFEYGSTPALGSTVAATPSSLSDTLAHSVSANLSGLQPGTTYYYRLRGQTIFGYDYGNIFTFYTGTPYSVLATLSATNATDSTATLNGSIGGFTSPVTISFQYGTSLSFGNTLIGTSPGYVTDSGHYAISGNLDHSTLQPHMLYFYRLVAQTATSTFYANTMTFYTGALTNTFATLTANTVTSTSATLNGSVSHFPTSVALSFEYGTTQSFGSTAIASPSTVIDTNWHQITASLTGLNPNTVYYYRLKGTYVGGVVYGGIRYFYTGASDIPDWDFQQWYGDTLPLPYYWRMLTDKFAQVPGHSGNYAAKIIGASGMLLGLVGDGGNNSGPMFSGGAPIHSRPDSLIVYLNYAIDPGDSATILIHLYKDTNDIATMFYLYTGNTGGAWQRTAVPIAYNIPSMIPDSVVLGFIAVNPMGANKANLNSTSTVAIDDITFSPPPAVAVPNAGLENWFVYGTEKLTDWHTTDFIGFDYTTLTTGKMVQKAYFDPPFDYAAEVSNVIIDGHFFGATLGTESSIFADNGPDFPVYINHQTLNGFYKFYPDRGDTLCIKVNMYKNGLQIAMGQFIQTDTVDFFTPFEATISYNSPVGLVADSAEITIEPHALVARGLSRAIVDKLSFDGYSIGVIEAAARKDGERIWCYPNPASTILTIEMAEPSPDADIVLSDINGRQVRILDRSGAETKLHINISDLSAGVYLLRVRIATEDVVKKIVVDR